VRLDPDPALEVDQKGTAGAEFVGAVGDGRAAMGQESIALALDESPSRMGVTEGDVASALESVGCENRHRISGFALARKSLTLRIQQRCVCEQYGTSGVAFPSDEAFRNGLPLLVGDSDEIQATGRSVGAGCGAENDRVAAEFGVRPVGIGVVVARDQEDGARSGGLDELANEGALREQICVPVEEITDDQDYVGASVAGDVEDERESTRTLWAIVT
jgi:hypothetical protein